MVMGRVHQREAVSVSGGKGDIMLTTLVKSSSSGKIYIGPLDVLMSHVDF